MLIAQVSDIHAAPENDHLQRFERVLTWLKHLPPDILVLTGDLTDGAWLEGYQQIANLLSKQNYPSLILPGNSDNRRLMRRVWGNDSWASDAPGESLHFIHDAGSLRLTGLDSTVSAQSYGSVADHLAWLEQQLSEAGESPTLLFMHHPVFACGIPPLDETMCRGLAKLEDLITRSPARILAISTGHVHRPVNGSFAGLQACICGSVCPANPLWFGTENLPPAADPPMLMIHRYKSNNLSSHHVCVQ